MANGHRKLAHSCVWQMYCQIPEPVMNSAIIERWLCPYPVFPMPVLFFSDVVFGLLYVNLPLIWYVQAGNWVKFSCLADIFRLAWHTWLSYILHNPTCLFNKKPQGPLLQKLLCYTTGCLWLWIGQQEWDRRKLLYHTLPGKLSQDNFIAPTLTRWPLWTGKSSPSCLFCVLLTYTIIITVSEDY